MGTESHSSLTARDLEVLEFLAQQRAAVTAQVAMLLGVTEKTATARCKTLGETGFVDFRPRCKGLWITKPGLTAIGSRLQAPRVKEQEYRHDVGLGWLALAAKAGLFGELAAIVSEREMHSHDARPGGLEQPYGVGLNLGGSDRFGDPHYPDLLLETASGHRIAVELELTGKSDRKLDGVMLAYACDGQVDRVLYLTTPDREGDRIARLIERAAARNHVSDMVLIQRLASSEIPGTRYPLSRAPVRAATRERTSTRGTERAL